MRHVIIRALEALEDGDVAFAREMLELVIGPRQVGCRCDDCGRVFEWPGLLSAHTCASWKARHAA